LAKDLLVLTNIIFIVSHAGEKDAILLEGR
jgi:hypothetical protein